MSSEAIRLLEEALHLRMNGEYAPGGKENWHDWDRKTEIFLRQQSDVALLGQRVRVKLDEHVITEGKLLGFDEGGEIRLEGDDGFVWHGWPALEVTPVIDAEPAATTGATP